MFRDQSLSASLAIRQCKMPCFEMTQNMPTFALLWFLSFVISVFLARSYQYHFPCIGAITRYCPSASEAAWASIHLWDERLTARSREALKPRDTGLGFFNPFQWRYNGHDDASNHQPLHCLLKRSVRRRSKKTSKLHVTGLCVRDSPVTGEFPSQKASNAENVFILGRHHAL